MIYEPGFGWAQAIVLLVAVQRMAETRLAKRNTQRLLAEGGVEHGAGHYPLFYALHGSWLLVLFLLVPPSVAPVWPLIGVFVALQCGRVWVIASLGRYWTTRIISLPEAPLVARGPYRWVRHPNYWVVAGEIAVLPLAFGAWWIAGGYTVLNAALLTYRIRMEEAALKPRRQAP